MNVLEHACVTSSSMIIVLLKHYTVLYTRMHFMSEWKGRIRGVSKLVSEVVLV